MGPRDHYYHYNCPTETHHVWPNTGLSPQRPDWKLVLGRLGVFTDILATLCTYGGRGTLIKYGDVYGSVSDRIQSESETLA